jgi:hypothetical protein
MKMAVLWVDAPSILVDVYRRSRGACYFHYQCDECLIMEAVTASETSVKYQTTRRNNPEDSHIYFLVVLAAVRLAH